MKDSKLNHNEIQKLFVRFRKEYPDFEDLESIKEELERNEIVLGGCLVTDHDPTWECNECNHRWGERDE